MRNNDDHQRLYLRRAVFRTTLVSETPPTHHRPTTPRARGAAAAAAAYLLQFIGATSSHVLASVSNRRHELKYSSPSKPPITYM